METNIPIERIYQNIYLIRGKKVMLDSDLAILYGVETRSLNQAVRRNIERFPEDFMFELSSVELKSLRSQIVISNGRGGARYGHMVFSEYGIAMLSSVLRSEKAVQVNIQIIRAFIALRDFVLSNDDLQMKIEALELRYDGELRSVFDALNRLLTEEEKPEPEIGFKT